MEVLDERRKRINFGVVAGINGIKIPLNLLAVSGENKAYFDWRKATARGGGG